MTLREIESEGVQYIHLAKDRVKLVGKLRGKTTWETLAYVGW